MIEVCCPNCDTFVAIDVIYAHRIKILSMEGDEIRFEGQCPKCKEKAEVRCRLHWQSL